MSILYCPPTSLFDSTMLKWKLREIPLVPVWVRNLWTGRIIYQPHRLRALLLHELTCSCDTYKHNDHVCCILVKSMYPYDNNKSYIKTSLLLSVELLWFCEMRELCNGNSLKSLCSQKVLIYEEFTSSKLGSIWEDPKLLICEEFRVLKVLKLRTMWDKVLANIRLYNFWV